MSNIKLYCITSRACVKFLNENALIRTQGTDVFAWKRYENTGTNQTVPIIALHILLHNDFME